MSYQATSSHSGRIIVAGRTAEQIEAMVQDTVHALAHIGVPVAPASRFGRNKIPDPVPFRIGQVAGVNRPLA